MKRSKLIISDHALDRIKERFPNISVKNIDAFVSAARYCGKSLDTIKRTDVKLYNFLKNRYAKNHSTKIILYKNGIFVFSGQGHKARTLITAVNIENYLEKFNQKR